MTTPATISVVVADDHALVRHGYRSILAGEDDIEVLGEASNGRDAVAAVRANHPDVVLMDVRMPALDGIEATRLITSDPELADTSVLVLTTFDLDEYVFGALRAGASGFLLKGVEPIQLVNAVRTVAAGDALLDPSATRRLIEAYTSGAPRHSDDPSRLPEDLTERELELLSLIAHGSTNAEIAEHLVISPLTVKSHVSRILAKTSARDRTQLVVMAYESGLVVPGSNP
jgi:DNA-binding NarL/FixJ family response regulator